MDNTGHTLTVTVEGGSPSGTPVTVFDNLSSCEAARGVTSADCCGKKQTVCFTLPEGEYRICARSNNCRPSGLTKWVTLNKDRSVYIVFSFDCSCSEIEI